MTSCASWPPKNAVTGAISLPRFCRKLRKNSLRSVSDGSCNSLCFSVARVVNSSRSACECEGRVPDMLWNSHRALRQVKSGGIWSLRLRELRCSGGMGELLARMIGE